MDFSEHSNASLVSLQTRNFLANWATTNVSWKIGTMNSVKWVSYLVNLLSNLCVGFIHWTVHGYEKPAQSTDFNNCNN